MSFDNYSDEEKSDEKHYSHIVNRLFSEEEKNGLKDPKYLVLFLFLIHRWCSIEQPDEYSEINLSNDKIRPFLEYFKIPHNQRKYPGRPLYYKIPFGNPISLEDIGHNLVLLEARKTEIWEKTGEICKLSVDYIDKFISFFKNQKILLKPILKFFYQKCDRTSLENFKKDFRFPDERILNKIFYGDVLEESNEDIEKIFAFLRSLVKDQTTQIEERIQRNENINTDLLEAEISKKINQFLKTVKTETFLQK